MITIALILALSGALIAGLVLYWKKIVKWIQKAVNKIKEVLGIAVQGTRTFITKTLSGFKNKSKYYNENKKTGEWEETVYTKEVDESEIPPEILVKVKIQKIDIEVQTTEDLKLLINA
jgi:hypothetical protein